MAMNWDDLRIVAAVCSTGSFTRAARELQVDETTVSRRMSRLETALDVTLFEAVDGHRSPTRACRAILRHLDEMEHSVSNISKLLAGQDLTQRRFRLTTVAIMAEQYLAPNLAGLLRELPELSLSIDTSDHNADMSRWEADFAIRLGRPKQGAFLMRRIGQIGFSLVRPRDAVARAGALVLSYPHTLSETPEMQRLLAATQGQAVRVETTDFSVIRRMLEAGQTIAAVPDFIARNLGWNTALESVPLEVEREVWLLSQPHLRNDPLARHVADWCSNLFAPRVT